VHGVRFIPGRAGIEYGSYYAAMKGAAKLRMVQTNFAGDVVSIIDPATNKVVGEIKGIEMAHGISVAKDNSQIYIAQEFTKSVLVVDGKTLQVTKRIALSGDPNLIQVTPDGKTMYVSINLRWDVVSFFPQLQADPSGGVDVIDTPPRLRKSKPSRSLAAFTTCT